ncbi:FAD:protein FMN transferase [Falsihalocynthiibacter sp. S25ZX9]|uniref:FAD:protein FMN transferase n=1 Tax=Falsihalocynthiibacter sp. S25ZX9 TaxID=3240870 RepID=UPI00350FD944
MTYTRRKFLVGTGAMFWATALRAQTRDVLQIEGPAFGASWRIRIAAGADAGAIVSAVKGIVTSVDGAMSPFLPMSEISRFNRMETLEWVPLSAQTHTTIREAKRVATLTRGAFDPTLGGVAGRYGFGPITQQPAGRFGDLELGAQSAKKAHISQTLDLCGIAKGHALDRIATALMTLGQASFFIELGGEVYALGHHPAGRPWYAGIERPEPQSAALQRVVAIDGEALATSGDRVNRFDFNGRRYGHIIDPKLKRPADTPLACVSVFAPQAITADALATALFAMGPEQGISFANREHIPALFVVRDASGLREVMTANFSTRIIG